MPGDLSQRTPGVSSLAALAPTGSTGEPRRVYPLAGGFRFHLGADDAARFERGDFDDSSWAIVTLPHTWNAEDGTSAFRRGAGWYRYHFKAPPEPAGRRAYIRFAGVSMVSTVWLNERELGTHWGAHSAFCYDATDALRPGAENVLVVRADNSWRDDVPPREGDFTMFGGIYRDASLITVAPLSIDLLDDASPGVYLTTPDLTAQRGVLRARVRVRNADAVARVATVTLSIRDGAGYVVASREVEHKASFGATEALLELQVERPRLWRARIDPYLYSAVVEIRVHGGLVDRLRQPIGFRTFQMDAERGFLLNGEPYDLHGANLHQDWEGVGWAMSPTQREQDFRLLLEMGATFVRLVHYQHDAQAYDLADRFGLIVWTEHGLVNTVAESSAFAERATLQLTELIRQNYNHPSIVVWGIGNEVQAQTSPTAARLLERLASLVKAEDPSRPSTLATCFDEPAGAYGADLIAHNKYFGWYQGAFADFPIWLDEQRSKNPMLPIGMSEYGAGAGPHLHSRSPRAMDHSEEYQSLLHEAYWRALRERPWVWCKAVWQMFDAASSSRHEGERTGINDKGLVARDRRIQKDAFHWYKANWTEDPFVYITSRRFTPRSEPKVQVKIYSNCDEVGLWHNGRSLGVQSVDDHVARWTDVRLAPGDNRIRAMARCRGVEVSDECVWVLE